MIFIPYNVPSLKNSKIATSKGVFPSKTVKKYLRALGIQKYSARKKEVLLYKTIPLNFPVEELKELIKDKEYPVKVGFYFIRSNKRDFDFNNANHIILDLLTAFDIITDDSMKYVIPYCMKIDNTYYTHDKENPGVWIDFINS